MITHSKLQKAQHKMSEQAQQSSIGSEGEDGIYNQLGVSGVHDAEEISLSTDHQIGAEGRNTRTVEPNKEDDFQQRLFAMLNNLTQNQAELKQSFTQNKTELKQDQAELKQSLKQDQAELKQSLKQDQAELKQSLTQDQAELKQSLTQNITELKQNITQNQEETRQKIQELHEKIGINNQEPSEKFENKITDSKT
jgi:uncharacterized protein involved in exopolysaccharide biosynthesis